ncbi:hypothetical protein T31B1_01505 [Salinisphaera sp. T31B1]
MPIGRRRAAVDMGSEYNDLHPASPLAARSASAMSLSITRFAVRTADALGNTFSCSIARSRGGMAGGRPRRPE